MGSSLVDLHILSSFFTPRCTKIHSNWFIWCIPSFSSNKFYLGVTSIPRVLELIDLSFNSLMDIIHILHRGLVQAFSQEEGVRIADN